MKRWLSLAMTIALVATALAVNGIAAAQERPAAQDKAKDCPQPSASVRTEAKAGAPAHLEGRVVNVDPKRGEVSVRTSEGATQTFRASSETLRDFKVGDRIEGQLRSQS